MIWLRHPFPRFLIVGFSNTLLGLAVIALAIEVFGFGDISANAAGYLVGFLWSFGFNRSWTFGHSGAPAGALVRYAIVCAAGYAVNVVTLLSARSAFPEFQMTSQLLAVVAYSAVVYLGSRYFAFVGNDSRYMSSPGEAPHE